MSKSWNKHGSNYYIWRKIRREVLDENIKENGGRCTLRIKGICEGEATQVHHVLGREVTGDDRRYLVASCRACNLHVGKPKNNNPKPKKVSKW